MTDEELTKMVDKIAAASGYGGLDSSTMYGEFALGVAKAVRDACAQACEAEHVGNSLTDGNLGDGDFAYNQALQHAAARIRGA